MYKGQIVYQDILYRFIIQKIEIKDYYDWVIEEPKLEVILITNNEIPAWDRKWYFPIEKNQINWKYYTYQICPDLVQKEIERILKLVKVFI